MAAIHEGLHEKDPVAAGGFQDHPGIGRIESRGFFTQNVFARLSGCDGVFRMHGVRRRDIDNIHVRIREEAVVAGIGPDSSMGRGKSFRGLPNEAVAPRLRLPAKLPVFTLHLAWSEVLPR